LKVDHTKFWNEAKVLASIFLPLYAIHCVEQVYYVYGNVLESYGFSPQATGNALGSYFMAIMLARPLGGWMLENLGIRRTMLLSGLFSFVGCSMLFFPRGVPLIFAGRLISGAAFGVFTIGLYSYQGLITTNETRGKFFAITGVGGVLPASTITPLGEWLVLGGHLKSFLALGPILSLICFFLGTKVEANKIETDTDKKEWGTYRDLSASRPFVMLAVTGMMMALVDASTTSISLFASERNLIVSYFFVSFSVTATLIRLCGAKLSNRLPRQFCVAPCGMLIAGSIAIVSLVPSNTSFIICGTLFGLGIGGGFSMMLASVSDILPPALRPKGTACTLLLYDLGWTATPLLVGYMTPIVGRAASFVLLAIVTFVTLAALMIFYWIPRRRNENRAKRI
jgi:MFS family permease